MSAEQLIRTGIHTPASETDLSETISLFANYAAVSADNAGNMVGALLVSRLKDPTVVGIAHDLLNELYTIRLASLLLLELSTKMLTK